MASVPPGNANDSAPGRFKLSRNGRALAAIVCLGLIARFAAAGLVQWYTQRLGKPCLFGDTFIYLDLATKIRQLAPFEVNQFGVPHYALRTPGYPLFLAACQAVFGSSYLAIRLVQAILNAASVVCAFWLFQNTLPAAKGWPVALIAAALVALEPYGIGLGALILSEGPFVPLMFAGLWGFSCLWRRDGKTEPNTKLAIATGAIHAAAVLVRPSWALIIPCLLVAWIVQCKPEFRRVAFKNAGFFILAFVIVMAPWWVRNARVFGKFVPTALWVGASLYDGISPQATGASDMRFLSDPGIVELDETTQDRVLKNRAVDFARTNPGRIVELAAIKFLRFWSPWPNADTLQSPLAAVLSAVVTIPLFALAMIGAWDRRRDFRTLLLLAGPLIYFLILHMVFVSSIRYRIPGFLVALGLVAVGWKRVVAFRAGGGESHEKT